MISGIAVCACLLSLPLLSQNPTPPKRLNLVVVQGDGAINNVLQRVTREPIVQVVDENQKPVAGAVVTFMLPDKGASAAFLDGSRTFVTVTDEGGRAAANGMQANKLAGKYQIRVSASHQGQTASLSIGQVNAIAAAAGAAGASTAAGTAAAAAGMGKVIAIVAIVAGAAVGGGVMAASKGGGSSSPSPTAPVQPTTTVIVPGTITVGPPR